MTKQISITWSIEDVLYQAANEKISLTEQEASDVLEMMERHHDATIGINWNVISYHIDRVIEERKDIDLTDEPFKTKEEFIKYLEQTIIPSLKDEDNLATAMDFEMCIKFMGGK